MSDSNYLVDAKKGIGDTAIDGLLAGLGAGIVSFGFLLLAALLLGEKLQVIASRFDPRLEGDPFIGGLFHMAISTIYGVIFGLILSLIFQRRRRVSYLTWLLGLIYGLFLWLIAKTIFSTGLESQLATMPGNLFILFHLIYGLFLGIIVARANNNGE